jgi:hypothetical protein
LPILPKRFDETRIQVLDINGNRFYYNRIVSAQNHYLLAPKRHVGDFDKLTQEEKNEFESINYQLKARELGDWDSMIENFPKAQSIPEHLHFHLLRKFDK